MAQATRSNRYVEASQKLEAVGQEHILRFYEELSPAEQTALLDQVQSVDWQEVGRLIQTHVKRVPTVELPQRLEPPPYYPYRPGPDLAEKYQQARRLGERLIGEGRVAAFTVAGGQGTRLGWDAPKGTFPATPIRNTPLFGVFAEYLRKVQSKYDVRIPWYVMTSPLNDAATRAFFQEHRYFGLEPDQVMLFPQGMMPAIDRQTAKVLMEDRGRMALSPNGHGGSLKALHDSGALADMRQRGVEHISYIQVDNPCVKVIDPLFIGLHALDEAQMSSKMLPKAYPEEKLGVFCQVDGRIAVIEYSDLPQELAQQREADGQLRFRAGSIAIHAIRVDFVESLNAGEGFRLPFHRAEKKVPYLDLETGRCVEPASPNAVKLETFVFDALPLCNVSIIYETDRVEEFAPIKNAEGVDSPQTSRDLQVERAARWLEANGVRVPRDAEGKVQATIEIQPTTAIEPADLQGVKLPAQIEPGSQVLL